MIGDQPLCMQCKHLDENPEATKNTCDAYPEGIPDEIFLSKVIHREPYDGDHGIQFEKVDEE